MSEDSLAMMPWFPRDFITATLGWRLLERALYRCLLDAQWELESLPHDEEELARIAGATESEFQAAWPKVKRKFEQGEDGRLRNLKLEEHRTVALERREKKRAAGRAGGQASVQARTNQRLSKRSTSAQAKGQAKSNPPSPSPSPSPSMKGSKNPPTPHETEFDHNFAQFQSLYPRRAGDQRWETAKSHIRANLKNGYTWEQILDGTRAYAEWARLTGKEGTESVKQAATFVGRDKAFSRPQDFAAPPTKADVRLAGNLAAAEEFMQRTGGI